MAIEERHKDYVSVSELREFLSCPLRWWYKYRLGLWTEKTTTFFALGTSVHAGLATWYGNSKLPNRRDMTLRIYRATYAEESSKVDWAAVGKRDQIGDSALGEKMLIAGIDAGDDWEAEAVERTMFAEISHSKFGKLPIKLKAQVDMITKQHDVVEHKTAERKWEAGREHGDIQATAYALAVRENFGHDPKITFNIITKSVKSPIVERRETRRTQYELDKLYIQARSFLDSVEKGAIYPNPSSWAHANCEYKEVCNRWESHPQDLSSRESLKNLIPNLREKKVTPQE